MDLQYRAYKCLLLGAVDLPDVEAEVGRGERILQDPLHGQSSLALLELPLHHHHMEMRVWIFVQNSWSIETYWTSLITNYRILLYSMWGYKFLHFSSNRDWVTGHWVQNYWYLTSLGLWNNYAGQIQWWVFTSLNIWELPSNGLKVLPTWEL